MAAAAPAVADAGHHVSSSSSSSHGGLLRPGSTLGNQRVYIESGERLGHGTFSEIFLGTNLINKNRYALKVDKPGPRMALQWESDVLLKLQKYPFAARHYGLYTMPDKKLQVLAMQLLGNSISALRRKQPDSFMPYASVCHITLQMLAAIEGLHQEGYIHRDLKPSNFVHGLGKNGKRQVYIIDFGQSRMYVDEAGNVRQARPFADFRGTSLYSSLHAHQLKDLGRRDDLWALWYIFCELARGGLPWKCVKEDRYHCEIAKKWYVEHPAELTFNLPGESHLLAWHAHLKSLSFEAKPDYGFVASCIKGALAESIATKKALQRNFGAYRDNELFKTTFDDNIYRAHSYFHYCAAKQQEAEKNAAKASAGQPTQPPAPVVGSTTVLFWNAELTTACHPSANTLQLISSQDATGESADLVNLFDQTDVPYSSDCTLECRGGVAHSWETDNEGNPIYAALKVNEQGDLTVESDTMVDALRAERDHCQAVVDQYYHSKQASAAAASAAGGAGGVSKVPAGSLNLPTAAALLHSGLPPAIDAKAYHHNHHSTDMMGPGTAAAFASGGAASASGDDGLSPSAGRKRRRNGEVMILEYGGKSDGYVVSDLTQRLTDLRGVLEKSVADIVSASTSAPTNTSSSAAASSSSAAAPALTAATAVEPEVVARALGTYAAAWRRVAEAALQRFEPLQPGVNKQAGSGPASAASRTAASAPGSSVRADVVLLFKRILDATTTVPPVSYPVNGSSTAAAGGVANGGPSTAVMVSAPASSSRAPPTSKVPSFGDVSTASGSGVSATASISGLSSSTTPMTILPSAAGGGVSASAATGTSVVPPAILMANDFLSSSGGMLALPYLGGPATAAGVSTGGDKVGLQVTIGRVEAWLAANADKASGNPNFGSSSSNAMDESPASSSSNGVEGLASSTSSGSGGPGAGAAATAEAEALTRQREADAFQKQQQQYEEMNVGLSAQESAAAEEMFKAAEERLHIMTSILKALDRERDLMRAPIAPENWKSKSGFVPPSQALLAYQQQVHMQRQYHLTSSQTAAPPQLTHLSSFTTAASVRYTSATSATSGTGAFPTGMPPPGSNAHGSSLFTPLSSAVSGLNLVAAPSSSATNAGAGAAPVAAAGASRRSNGAPAANDDVSMGSFVTGTGAIPGTGGLGGASTSSTGAAEPPAAKRSRVNDGGSAASTSSAGAAGGRK